MSEHVRIETTVTTPGFRRGLLKSCALIVTTCIALASLAACNSSGRISEENSRLRRENLELTEKAAQLVREIELRDGQIKALAAKGQSPGPAVEGVKPADLPVVSKLSFGAYSGAFDSDGNGSTDTVRIYLLTLDQHGRFYPAIGKAVVQVVSIETDQPPRQIVRKTFDAKAFGEAYVSGFTGTHFTLELKLESALPKDVKELTIKVTYTDAATGAALGQQMVSAVR
ncbi:MAG: hypothetical protein WD768_13020 [Phycisphaeraceae bacterium]